MMADTSASPESDALVIADDDTGGGWNRTQLHPVLWVASFAGRSPHQKLEVVRTISTPLEFGKFDRTGSGAAKLRELLITSI